MATPALAEMWTGAPATVISPDVSTSVRVGSGAPVLYGGAVVGSFSGFAVSMLHRGPATPLAGVPRTGREVITTAEIRQSGRADMYSVISVLRPEWLVTQGTNSFRETPKGQSVGLSVVITDEGIPTLKVYLNNAYLGGIETLREIPAADASVVEYLTPAEATQRFGAGHTHGAIIVYTTN